MSGSRETRRCRPTTSATATIPPRPNSSSKPNAESLICRRSTSLLGQGVLGASLPSRPVGQDHVRDSPRRSRSCWPISTTRCGRHAESRPGRRARGPRRARPLPGLRRRGGAATRERDVTGSTAAARASGRRTVASCSTRPEEAAGGHPPPRRTRYPVLAEMQDGQHRSHRHGRRGP